VVRRLEREGGHDGRTVGVGSVVMADWLRLRGERRWWLRGMSCAAFKGIGDRAGGGRQAAQGGGTVDHRDGCGMMSPRAEDADAGAWGYAEG
jgi:hypothetical protein